MLTTAKVALSWNKVGYYLGDRTYHFDELARNNFPQSKFKGKVWGSDYKAYSTDVGMVGKFDGDWGILHSNFFFSDKTPLFLTYVARTECYMPLYRWHKLAKLVSFHATSIKRYKFLYHSDAKRLCFSHQSKLIY